MKRLALPSGEYHNLIHTELFSTLCVVLVRTQTVTPLKKNTQTAGEKEQLMQFPSLEIGWSVIHNRYLEKSLLRSQ